MLSWSDVLFYVRNRLALPSTFIEKNDKEIKEYVQRLTIPLFSDYVPDWERTTIIPENDRFKTENKNIYKFYDEEDLAIYGVKEAYWDGSGYLLTGHPYFPVWGFDDLKNFALQAFKSNMVKPYSFWGFTTKFIRPNKIQVLPENLTPFIIDYEREQPHDLRKIPTEHKRNFMDLALADIMLWIGAIRTMYQTISTPFGDIPLNGDILKSEGETLKRETEDKLRDAALPGIVIDIE